MDTTVAYLIEKYFFSTLKLSKVIALPTIAIAIVVAKTIEREIEKRSHKPMYKVVTKNEAKGVKCDNFRYRKIRRAITTGCSLRYDRKFMHFLSRKNNFSSQNFFS